MFKHSFKKILPFFLSSLIIFGVIFFYLLDEVINTQEKKSFLNYKYFTSITSTKTKDIRYDPEDRYNDISEFNSAIIYIIETKELSLKAAVAYLVKLNLDNINRAYNYKENKLDNDKPLNYNYILKRFGPHELILLHNDVSDIEHFKIFINSKLKKFVEKRYGSNLEKFKTNNFLRKNYDFYSKENLINFRRWNEFTSIEKNIIFKKGIEELRNVDAIYKFINFSDPEIINQSQIKFETLSINLLRIVIILFLSYILSNIFYTLKIKYFK